MMQTLDDHIRRALSVESDNGQAFVAEVAARMARRTQRLRLLERSLILTALAASAIALAPAEIQAGQALAALVDLPLALGCLAVSGLLVASAPRMTRLARRVMR